MPSLTNLYMTYSRSSRKAISWLFITITLIMIPGCKGAYRIKAKDYNKQGQMIPTDFVNYQDALLFVHLADKVVQIAAPIFNNETSSVSGQLVPTNTAALARYDAASKKGWPKSNRNAPGPDMKQIHFYVEDYTENVLSDGSKEIIFYKNHVLETHLLKHMPGSGAGGTLVIIAGAFAIFLIIVCNCPHVYAVNGDGYYKLSNAFVGSVSAALERTDYSILPHKDDDLFTTAVVNATNGETQFLNQVEFIEIEHGSSTSILNDQHGKFYTVLTDDKLGFSDHPALTKKNDNITLQFNSLNKNDLAENIIKFPVKKGDNPKLILSVKNTTWSSFVIEEWYQLFGDKIDTYRDKMANKSKQELTQWRKEQGMLLDVYVKKDDNWVLEESLDLVGSSMHKDLVVCLNNSSLDKDSLEVKFVTGYRLWEIDYACVDYSENEVTNITYHKLGSAALNGTNISSSKLDDIDNTFEELGYNDTLKISYVAKKHPETKTSYAISLTGYYKTKINQKNKIQRRELYSFKKPGQMSRYSYHLMKELSESLSTND